MDSIHFHVQMVNELFTVWKSKYRSICLWRKENIIHFCFESTNFLRNTKLVFNNKLHNLKKNYFESIPLLKSFWMDDSALQSKLIYKYWNSWDVLNLNIFTYTNYAKLFHVVANNSVDRSLSGDIRSRSLKKSSSNESVSSIINYSINHRKTF